jgi:hypothetical protein
MKTNSLIKDLTGRSNQTYTSVLHAAQALRNHQIQLRLPIKEDEMDRATGNQRRVKK